MTQARVPRTSLAHNFCVSHSQGRTHLSSTNAASPSHPPSNLSATVESAPHCTTAYHLISFDVVDCNPNMSIPRRSARLSPNLNQQHQQQQQQQQPQNHTGLAPAFGQFSQPSSTSTTSYPSPSHDSANPPPPPPTPAQARLQVHPNFTPPNHQGNAPHLYAPLPSPSVDNMGQGSFFNQPHPQQQGQQQQSAHRQQASSPAYQGHQQGHHNSMSQPHPPNIQNSNGGQLPPDFLAEAAKRAQMACLMRDLGDVSL